MHLLLCCRVSIHCKQPIAPSVKAAASVRAESAEQHHSRGDTLCMYQELQVALVDLWSLGQRMQHHSCMLVSGSSSSSAPLPPLPP
jgi:hypothetical protein